MDKRLADFEAKLAELESEKIQLENEVASLRSKLNEIQTNHSNLETELTAKLAILEPKHKIDFEEYETNKNRLSYMKSHTVEMNERIVDMANSKKMMLKAIEKTNAEIKQLT